MKELPTQKSLDEAAVAAGYRDYACARSFGNQFALRSIWGHAKTIDHLHGRVREESNP